MQVNPVEERICAAVRPIVPVIVPGTYSGPAPTYCTYNFFRSPEGFGDNRSRTAIAYIQVHLFTPGGGGQGAKKNPWPLARRLGRALEEAGFTAAEMSDASDDEYQHIVLEVEGLDCG